MVQKVLQRTLGKMKIEKQATKFIAESHKGRHLCFCLPHSVGSAKGPVSRNSGPALAAASLFSALRCPGAAAMPLF